MSKQLYLTPSEIEIQSIPHDEYKYKKDWATRIKSHEFVGLRRMGCEIQETPELTIVNHPSSNLAFLNRIINVNTSEEYFSEFIANADAKFSFVIDPFTCPDSAIHILEQKGYINSISSTVVGGEVPTVYEAINHNFDMSVVDASGKEFEKLFDVFATFFLKPGESLIEAKSRLLDNLDRGTHVLVKSENIPIGMVGTIDCGDTSSIYCGIILPEYRASNVLNALGNYLSQCLSEKGVKQYYGKSRNRAFLIGLRRMFGFEHLFNEKTFILNKQ